MIWLTVEQILALHRQIIQQSGGVDGVRDAAALAAAVSAPFQTFQRKDLFPGTIEKIARIGYGLVVNHAFADGNKRIGALTMQILLQENGYQLSLRRYELSDIFISIASGETKYQDFTEWISAHLITERK